MKKVAVVGLGNIATRHRNNLKQLFPDSKLYAMSSSGRVQDELISDCDGLVGSVYELIQKNVQLVIVASPAPFHAKHTVPLIQAGIPTLIEKPVTTTLKDVALLESAIETYKTPIAVGYCLRYLSSAIKVKQLISDGIIGVLYNAHIQTGQYLPDWRPGKNFRDTVSANEHLGGGVLFELSHELDYIRWLLGSIVFQHAILRSSSELALNVEDMADITISTATGAVGYIHLDFLQRKACRKCSFIGSKGRLDWDLIGNEVSWSSEAGTEVLFSEPEWDKNQMYLNMIKDFVHMIEGKPYQCTELADAAETIRLIEEIKKQASYI